MSTKNTPEEFINKGYKLQTMQIKSTDAGDNLRLNVNCDIILSKELSDYYIRKFGEIGIDILNKDGSLKAFNKVMINCMYKQKELPKNAIANILLGIKEDI